MKPLFSSRHFFALVAGSFLFLGIEGCDQGKELSNIASTPVIKDSTVEMDLAEEDTAWDIQSEYDTVYITIADTGSNYHVLDAMMYALRGMLPATVDTLGRFYDEGRDSLVLPLDVEDEIWAGDYYPRRIEGGELSLEYLAWYTDRSLPNTFALFTGIWPSRASADSAVSAQRHAAQKAFVLEASIYMGCMH